MIGPVLTSALCIGGGALGAAIVVLIGKCIKFGMGTEPDRYREATQEMLDRAIAEEMRRSADEHSESGGLR